MPLAAIADEMFRLNWMSRNAARGLVVLLAAALSAAPALAGACSGADRPCSSSAAHAHQHRCPPDQAALSCDCGAVPVPASRSAATAIGITAAPSSSASVHHYYGPTPPTLRRPDFSMARGRQRVVLPILYASLLI